MQRYVFFAGRLLAARPHGIKSNIQSVIGYNESQGRLYVEHNYSLQDTYNCGFQIDVDAVLETTQPSCFEPGSWINVIGFIAVPACRGRKRKQSDLFYHPPDQDVVVQAVLIWNAGAVRITEYEKIMERQKQAAKTAAERRNLYT